MTRSGRAEKASFGLPKNWDSIWPRWKHRTQASSPRVVSRRATLKESCLEKTLGTLIRYIHGTLCRLHFHSGLRSNKSSSSPRYSSKSTGGSASFQDTGVFALATRSTSFVASRYLNSQRVLRSSFHNPPCDSRSFRVKKQVSQGQAKLVGIGLANLQIFPAALRFK